MGSNLWLIVVEGNEKDGRAMYAFETLEEATTEYRFWVDKGFHPVWFECTELPLP
jgi:hypothetical protein